MRRPLRIEYAGARYHVICRGNQRTVVFGSNDDVRLFLKTLAEAVKRSELRVHAYVLMNTHYHLLLETPSGNLVEGMKWLQEGACTQRMNAMHNTWGHLFQGRYKAKEHYSLSNRRISEMLHMGHPTFISKCRAKIESDRKLKKGYEKLKREVDCA